MTSRDLSNIDQGADLAGEGETVICSVCRRTVAHSIGPVLCIGERGWHAQNPKWMVPAEDVHTTGVASEANSA